MPSSSKLFEQVDQALTDARILDRDMVRDLLELARALEAALVDSCRANLAMQAMDSSVVSASNQLRDATEALNKAYIQKVDVDAFEVERLFESQLTRGRSFASKQS